MHVPLKHLQDTNDSHRLLKLLLCKPLTVSFLYFIFLTPSPVTGVRGDKQELLSSTVRRISTKDIVGSLHDSSVALEVSVNVHPPEVLVLIAFPLKPILFFFFFLLEPAVCSLLKLCQRYCAYIWLSVTCNLLFLIMATGL